MAPKLVATALEGMLLRYPMAELHSDGQWILLTGDPEFVLPADIHDSDQGLVPDPTPLSSSVGDAFDHFLVLSSLRSGQADHLLEHTRQFGISPLCRDHGLPVWHKSPARTDGAPGKGGSCFVGGPSRESSTPGVRVEDATRIARFFDCVLDLAYSARRGKRISRWHVEGVQVPGFDRSVAERLALAELDREGAPLAGRTRDLVAQGAERWLKQTATRAGVSWLAHRTPELVMKSEDVWGLYGLETIRRLAVDGDRRPVLACEICGTPVVLPRRPREGDRVYCKAVACRRERERLRKAEQRARARKEGEKS